MTVADPNDVGLAAGSANGGGLLTRIVYVFGPTVTLVPGSVTEAVNETVVAAVGVPLMVNTPPFDDDVKPSDNPATVQL